MAATSHITGCLNPLYNGAAFELGKKLLVGTSLSLNPLYNGAAFELLGSTAFKLIAGS